MFLFTNAPVGTSAPAASGRAAAGVASGAATAKGPVIDAIREGAQRSGVGFDYLLATAQRESSLDPSAKAATSSATGLYQFIEQTWLGTMKNAGPALGLSSYADAITARPDGGYTVADPSARQTILDLRRDPRVSAAMAGALTQRNRESLGSALGREPTSGDLYAAHVLGAKGAATLIGSAQASPARAAALDLPEAAASNRSLFYDKFGRPRGSAELYALLSTSTAGGTTAVAAASNLPEMTTSYAALDGIRSLFQTDKRQGAISESVAKLWQGRAANAEAGRPVPTYFPRSGSDETSDVAASSASETVAPPATAESIVVPLPPRRPAELTAASTASSSAAAAKAPAEPAARGASLFDLTTYRLRNGS